MGMAPRIRANLIYAGKNITTSLRGCNSGFSYSDPDGGESDAVQVKLADPQKKWIGPWYPTKGDKIDVALELLHWDGKEGSLPQKINCGSFTIDKLGISPGAISIGGVSRPANKDFASTDRTKTWERVTLQQIAQDVAGRAGIALYYDAGNIPIAKEEQTGPDSDFLEGLCARYGLRMKVYRDRLVIFDRTAYKKKPPVMTFSAANRELGENWSYEDNLEPYTGVELTYTNGDGKDIKYKSGGGDRILRMNQNAADSADAERIAKAALEKENHGAVTISFQARARKGMCASQTIRVAGTGGKPDRVYYVDSLDYSVDDGGLIVDVKGSGV